MESNSAQSLPKVYFLPTGIKLRKRKFGGNPLTPFVTVGAGVHGVGEGPSPFQLRWDDATLGLSVLLSERVASGRLEAEVSCADPAMLNKAAVSVALVGKREDEMIRKTIPLAHPDPRTGGCSGAADFGLLTDATRQLGSDLGLVVFMLC